MKCIKCGRETDQTFCEKCRAEMEKYPVKPGTIVLLPKERPANKKPQPRHQATPPEEKLRSQRRTIRRLSRAVAVLLVLLVLTGIAIVQLVEKSAKPAVGQNYSTVTKPSGSPRSRRIPRRLPPRRWTPWPMKRSSPPPSWRITSLPRRKARKPPSARPPPKRRRPPKNKLFHVKHSHK